MDSSSLTEIGINSKIFYSNMLFAKIIGQEIPDLYQRLSLVRSTSLAGEWIFASTAFPHKQKAHQYYGKRRFTPNVSVPMLSTSISYEDLLKCQSFVPEFLNLCIKSIKKYNAPIIGISTFFQQTCAAISIAKEIKRNFPKSLIILGGGNCLVPMNYALDSLTRNTVDYIFSGEAEREFKDFCLNYLKEGVLPSKHLIECAPIPDLDLLPIPDYDEYYGQLYEFGLESNIRRLGFESSRGCWWGEKSNCLFCGLNGIDIHYRQKSLKRICHEIEFLSKKYNVTLLQATDNIMPKDLPEALMQKFSPPSTLNSIYYEVRPTLSFEELYYCKKAGIKTLQPGMESLTNHLLFLLSKGLTASGNIRFLRDCRNLGIRLDWNLLYGIPGEEVKDYEEMLRIIPFISHLAPPDFIGPVNIQRYSPLYMNPKKYGISKIIPHPNYLEIYPDETDFFQFALYFESNFQTVFTGALEREFLAQISFWREKWKQNPPTLRAIKLNEETYLIDDTRSEVNQGIRLISAKYIKILNNFRNPVKRSQFDIDEIQLLKWGYLLKIGEYVVSLVCEPMQVLNYYEKFNKRIQ